MTAELQAAVPGEFGVAVANDQDLAAYAASDPMFTHYLSCGRTGPYWYFDLTTAGGEHGGFRVAIDGTGHASSLGFAPYLSHSSTCP